MALQALIFEGGRGGPAFNPVLIFHEGLLTTQQCGDRLFLEIGRRPMVVIHRLAVDRQPAEGDCVLCLESAEDFPQGCHRRGKPSLSPTTVVPFWNSEAAVLHLANPKGVMFEGRRRELDLIQWMSRRQAEAVGDPEISARIASYELAFRIQASVPALADLSDEPAHLLEMYGADVTRPSFARNFLLARRLVERGVRFVQLYGRGGIHTPTSTVSTAGSAARQTGRAAQLTDLRQPRLLDDTLVIWGGEFGRTPVAEVYGQTRGRDHHPHAFTMWLAGGGMKRGLTCGTTDEFGYHVAEDPVPVHDLHATILHQLGIDHERRTFRTQGRDFRLTDVKGRVVRALLE